VRALVVPGHRTKDQMDQHGEVGRELGPTDGGDMPHATRCFPKVKSPGLPQAELSKLKGSLSLGLLGRSRETFIWSTRCSH